MSTPELQMTFFAGPAAARKTDPETSRQAAREVEASGQAKAHRTMCLQEVRRMPGRTAGEIAYALMLSCHQVGKRLPELHAAGLIYPGEARRCSVEGTRQRTWYPGKKQFTYGPD